MLLYRSAVMLLFQSTLPREERPYPLVSYLINLLFQSTLPREERRNHTCVSFEHDFNPRSREEERRIVCHVVKITLFQSTLPREERLIRILPCRQITYFNPRSHESDLNQYLQGFCGLLFQSTLPRGATGTAAYYSMPCDNFNPRSHERSDGLLCTIRLSLR